MDWLQNDTILPHFIVQTGYIQPDFPIDVPTFDQYEETSFPFGKEAKRKHFYLEVSWLQLFVMSNPRYQ